MQVQPLCLLKQCNTPEKGSNTSLYRVPTQYYTSDDKSSLNSSSLSRILSTFSPNSPTRQLACRDHISSTSSSVSTSPNGIRNNTRLGAVWLPVLRPIAILNRHALIESGFAPCFIFHFSVIKHLPSSPCICRSISGVLRVFPSNLKFLC